MRIDGKGRKNKCRIGKCRKKNRQMSKAIFDKLKTKKRKNDEIHEKIQSQFFLCLIIIKIEINN